MDKTAKVMEVCKDVGCINRNVTKLLIDNGLNQSLPKCTPVNGQASVTRHHVSTR
jgi:hypothetical protein